MTTGRGRSRTLLTTTLTAFAVGGAVGGVAAVGVTRRRSPRSRTLTRPVLPQPQVLVAPVRQAPPPPLLPAAAPTSAASAAASAGAPSRSYLYAAVAPAAAPVLRVAPAPTPPSGWSRTSRALAKAGCAALTVTAVVVLPTGQAVQRPERPVWPALAAPSAGGALAPLLPLTGGGSPGVRLVAESTDVPVVLAPQTSAYGGGALAPIPTPVLAAYQAAAAASLRDQPGCNLSWSVLAAVVCLESRHAVTAGAGVVGWSGIASPPILGPVLDGHPGVATVPDTDGGRLDGDATFDRAVGPMQFLPQTWAAYGADGDGDGLRDPQDIRDATLAAAHYLCDGAGDLSDPTQLVQALLRYNPDDAYVRSALALGAGYLAASYGRSSQGYAQAAMAFGYARLGDPYAWGGTGPLYDCSGLVQAAYRSAGLSLPRTAEEQWRLLPHVGLDQLQPGDLLFFNPGEFQPDLPGHVGIYVGAGMMLDDPHTGAFVRLEPVRGFGELIGAARPALLATTTDAAPGTGFVLTPVLAQPTATPPPAAVPSPVSAPSPTPSASRSATPVPLPPASPTAIATSSPTSDPMAEATTEPTTEPTAAPAGDPTPAQDLPAPEPAATG